MVKLILFFFCLISGKMFTQDQTIPNLNEKVTLDGNLNETVWEKAITITGFHNNFPIDKGKAEKQMTVKIFHDTKNLYVSATYFDITDEIQISSLKRDDLSNSIGASDAFIVVIDPFNQEQNGYYFASNMGEAQVDALIERNDNGFLINNTWSTAWTVKTGIHGNNKVYEMEIPLKSLGYSEENTTWGFLFYANDMKANQWISYKEISRNYSPYDLRFSTPFQINDISGNSGSKFTITPSITYNHQEELEMKETNKTFKASLDLQYNLTSALKLDATLNPDFSQIDVDQQVVNLTRFAVNFPEVRNFFLENSDLFSGLGPSDVNPFYSRKVGATSDISYGIKLSGNITNNTRLGILDVQTKDNKATSAQNYSATVIQQKLSNSFSATAFLISRQETDGIEFLNNYNRVTGLNLNYKSIDNKWTVLTNYGKSLSSNVKGDNNFYHAGIWYNERDMSWNTSIKRVETNYITDAGFVPRLNNYDAINKVTIRDSYSEIFSDLKFTYRPETSSTIDSYRYFFLKNNSYWDGKGKLTQSSSFFNNAVWFKNLSSAYINIYHEYEDLKYGFDLLRNGNLIKPSIYNYTAVQIGYNSVSNKQLVYNIAGRYGSYYNGKRTRAYLNLKYRLLPFASLNTSYEANKIDLNELGSKTFHLLRFTGEMFFSNRLNWTNYVQYNSRSNSFNVNSRLQWEYKPLSYVYLVVTDNFNKDIYRTNWGIAFKMSYRLGI
jgi:hypothetical protein